MSGHFFTKKWQTIPLARHHRETTKHIFDFLPTDRPMGKTVSLRHEVPDADEFQAFFDCIDTPEALGVNGLALSFVSWLASRSALSSPDFL